jgi:anti-sigma factor RsiW
VPTDSDKQLIAAYLDGVAELGADERRRVEELLRDDPAARTEADELRTTLASLRTLKPEGVEPEWTALERRIAAAVPATTPISWWRRLRWIVPIGGLAATAATALVLFHHPADHAVQIDAGPPIVAPVEPPPASTDELWLDGQVVEVGDVDPNALVDDDGGGTLAEDHLLPVQDLNWIDSLDDAAIDRAEHALARKPHKG